jgi:pSer/pThr/pTyr-binding forkhead associated (FHA) protein/uncharacterized RDD family membrane protein YckC
LAKLVINPTSASKKEIPILSRVISIGRDPSNDLVLSDSMVSRRHAILEQREDQYVLRDNNSSNGTLVNGDRLEKEQTLRDGDLVAIGSSRLLFQLSDSAETPAPAAASGGRAPTAPPQEAGSENVPSQVRCPTCGKKALATDRFCRGCGKELAEPKRSVACSQCGNEVKLPADFCGNCGTALAKPPKGGQATLPNRRSDLVGSSKPEDGAESSRPGAGEPFARRPPTPRRKPATDAIKGEPAGFGIRLVAALVDTTILGVPLILGALLWITFSMRDTPSPLLLGFVPVGYSILSVLYYLYFWGQRGATPGKSLLGLTVRTEDGDTPIGYGRACLRVLGYLVSSLPLCLGFLWIAFSEDKRGLHDRIAGTRVTRSP